MSQGSASAGPVATAYAALHRLAEHGLRAGGFLRSEQVLELDPESAFEPEGDETELITAAAMVQVATRPGRAEMGGPNGATYTVERDVRIELACAGPAAELLLRRTTLEAGLAAVADGVVQDAALGGQAERAWLVGREDGDLPPNGALAVLGVTLRVSAGDPLGLTWPR